MIDASDATNETNETNVINETNEIVVKTNGDGDCLFYALCLAFNSERLNDGNINTSFGDKQLLDVNGKYSVRVFREVAFTPITNILRQLGAMYNKKNNDRIKNYDATRANELFAEYNKYIEPHITTLREKMFAPGEGVNLNGTPEENQAVVASKDSSNMQNGLYQSLIDTLTCSNPDELNSKGRVIMDALIGGTMIWGEMHNMYEIEKAYNIKILAKVNNEYQPVNGLNNEIFIPTSDGNDKSDSHMTKTQYIVMQNTGGNHFDLIVTKNATPNKRSSLAYCAKYSVNGDRGTCVIPQPTRTLFVTTLGALINVYGGDASAYLMYLNGSVPFVNEQARVQEELRQEIGSSTETSSDASSDSAYTESGSALFTALIALGSFSEKTKMHKSSSVGTICQDPLLISTIKNDMNDDLFTMTQNKQFKQKRIIGLTKPREPGAPVEEEVVEESSENIPDNGEESSENIPDNGGESSEKNPMSTVKTLIGNVLNKVDKFIKKPEPVLDSSSPTTTAPAEATRAVKIKGGSKKHANKLRRTNKTTKKKYITR